MGRVPTLEFNAFTPTGGELEHAERGGGFQLAGNADRAVRIGGTRITLDVLAAHFEAGATPEEVVEQLDTLSLEDVRFVQDYCLRRPREVKEYLRARSERAERLRARIEAESGSADFIDGILARAGGE